MSDTTDDLDVGMTGEPDNMVQCPNCGGTFYLDEDYCEHCNYHEGR